MQIVLVDDEPLFLNTVADFLRRCGHQVIAAESGMRAISKIGNHVGDIDLIISDICMPKIDGPSLLRRIREQHSDIDAVLVTAHVTAMNARQAIAAGACALLHKPIRLGELEAVVSQIAHRRCGLHQSTRLSQGRASLPHDEQGMGQEHQGAPR